MASNSKPHRGQSCPECGSNQYREQEGCTLCPECGFSKCK